MLRLRLDRALTARLALAFVAAVVAAAGAPGGVALGAVHVRCLSELANRHCLRVRGLAEQSGVAVAFGGRNVYLTGGAVIALGRSQNSGRVRQLPGRRGCITGSASAAARSDCLLIRHLGASGGIAATADGRFVYVATVSPASLRAFRRDRHTGALRPLSGAAGCLSLRSLPGCGRARAIGYLTSVALSPDGRFLYATSVDDSAVLTFSRDPRTGALAQLPGAAGCATDLSPPPAGCGAGRALSSAQAVAVTRDGRNAYVVGGTSTDLEATGDGQVAVFSRDPASGVLTQLPGPAGCVVPTGGQSYDASPCTKAAAGLLSTALYSLAISPDGRNVYPQGWSADRGLGFTRGDVVTFTRSPVDGSLSQPSSPAACIGTVPGCQGAGVGGLGDVVVSPDGLSVYSPGGSHLGALTRDPGSGLLSVRRIVFNSTLLSDAAGAAVSPDGRDVFVTSLTVGGANPDRSRIGFDVVIVRGA